MFILLTLGSLDVGGEGFQDGFMRLATYCFVFAIIGACGDSSTLGDVSLTVLSARATGENAQVEIRLENQSPRTVPTDYSLFRLQADGLEAAAIDGTCPLDATVGQTVNCQLTFDLAEGVAPSALVYPTAEGDLVVPIDSFELWDVATLTPDFAPTPMTFSGATGGMTDVARTFAGGCLGFTTVNPNVVFTATEAFPYLRIVAQSATDTALVVEMADGTLLCNDEFEDLNPMVEGMFPAGEHKIWVARYNYDEELGALFTVGLTESRELLPSEL